MSDRYFLGAIGGKPTTIHFTPMEGILPLDAKAIEKQAKGIADVLEKTLPASVFRSLVDELQRREHATAG